MNGLESPGFSRGEDVNEPMLHPSPHAIVVG